MHSRTAPLSPGAYFSGLRLVSLKGRPGRRLGFGNVGRRPCGEPELTIELRLSCLAALQVNIPCGARAARRLLHLTLMTSFSVHSRQADVYCREINQINTTIQCGVDIYSPFNGSAR